MKIVILSRQPALYSTKWIVEAGEKMGHEMQVVDHLKCNIEIEKKAAEKNAAKQQLAAMIRESIDFFVKNLY